MALFSVKPEILLSPYLIGGVLGGIGIVVGTITKIMTKGHITEKRAFNKFQNKELCEEKHNNLENKVNTGHINLEKKIVDIDRNINQNIDRQFKIVIELIKRNGG